MIKWEIKGAKQLAAALKRKAAALNDMRPAYKKCSIYLDQWVQKNFKTQGGNVGGWAPFASSTLRSMAANDPKRASKPMLLVDTREMQRSFLPFYSKDNAGIGSRLPRAKMHDKGLGNVPARRLLPYNKEVAPELKEIFDQHIKMAIKK